MRRLSMFAAALALLAPVPAWAATAKIQWTDYTNTADSVSKGSALPAQLDKINGWLDDQGKDIVSGSRRQPVCAYQLKLLWFANKYPAETAPGAWIEEANVAIARAEQDASRCDGYIDTKKVDAAISRFRPMYAKYEQANRAKILAAAGSDCERRKSELGALVPLAGMSCEVGDDVAAFRARQVAAAQQALRDLDKAWRSSGRADIADALPRLDGIQDPDEAFSQLRERIQAGVPQRQALWQEKIGGRGSAIDALPAGAKSEWSAQAPPKTPSDFTAWAFWTELAALDAQVAEIRSSGADFERRKNELIATVRGLSARTDDCKALDELCSQRSTGEVCGRNRDIGALREACAAARLDDPSRATMAVLNGVKTARESIAADARWSAATQAFRDDLVAAANRAEKNCATQADILDSMKSAVGAVRNASLGDAARFREARSAITRCDAGLAGDYTLLAEAIGRVEAKGGSCASGLGREREQLEATARAITSRGAGAKKESQLTAGREKLAGAMECHEADWKERFARAKTLLAARSEIAGRAGRWIESVDDARYGAVRARIERAAPGDVPDAFRCDWDRAALATDPDGAIDRWASCEPVGADDLDDVCRLYLVAAVAVAAEDFAGGAWSAARSKFDDVRKQCGETLADGRDGEILDYFSTYAAWKTNAAAVSTQDTKVARLGYDPEFEQRFASGGQP